MKIFNWHRIQHTITHFLIVQLFLNMVSLPILVAWGLPLSILSPIGNAFFSPFLTIFLLLSSLIFFAEILCIPNTVFITVLEYVTSFWKYCLTFSSRSALYAFKKPPLLILILIPIVTALAIHHPLLRSPKKRLAGLLLITTFSWILLTFLTTTDHIHTVPCNKGFITIIRNNGTTTVLDPGLLGGRISAPSWISYTLIPEIVKQTGTLTIDTVICTKLGKIQFEALQILLEKAPVKKIYLPGFEGELEPAVKKSFNRFYATARTHGTTIIRTYMKPLTITEDNLIITLENAAVQTYHTVSYAQPIISASIDNTSVPIYDFHKSKSL